MTTLRAAAEKALNTFESMGHEDSIFAGEFDEIITALRTALQTPPPPPEAQSDGEKNAYHYGWWAAMEAVREQRTEPVQEPVAWANMRLDGRTPTMLSISQHPEDRANWVNPVPLYTHPPQRKPLSDEDIVDLWADVSMDYDDQINIIEMARAIERAHGIGGEA